MNYSVTFLEKDYLFLCKHLFADRSKERGAYALAKLSQTSFETRLLVTEVIPILEDEIISSSSHHMQIPSWSFMRAMKRANDTKRCFIFIHSHPKNIQTHSAQDDAEEKELFRTAYNRISTPGIHCSIVISSPEVPRGRVWLEDGSHTSLTLIRTVGKRFGYYSPDSNIDIDANVYDRQIRAFGSDTQNILKLLTVGIVGLGGTGSSVAEQLIRLGIGRLIVADGQTFEKSNVNRVYGSRVSDDGMEKVDIIARTIDEVGLDTKLIPLNKNITYKSVFQEFRNCDVIFGCTDDEWGRSILTKMAIYYLIPVFDMGVKIDSKEGKIKSIEGRVTTLLPFEACLFCRDRINSATIRIESLQELDPEQAMQLRKDGYAPELAEPAPSIIPFTTAIASASVSELIHRITGFLGSDRISNEVIYQFHELRIRTNYRLSKSQCFCGDPLFIGRGDRGPMLDLVWRPE